VKSFNFIGHWIGVPIGIGEYETMLAVTFGPPFHEILPQLSVSSSTNPRRRLHLHGGLWSES